MTVYTFETFEFVLNNLFSVHFFGFVATCTIYLGVFPFQFECRFIVVEFDGIPVGISMAPQTVRDAVFFKLPVMYVFVASCAGSWQTCKLLISHWQMIFVTFLPVTGHTGLFGMCAL